MFAYPILIAFLVGSGVLIGWIGFSYWWGIIPVLIGGFCGSYFSKFGRLLLTPDLSAYQREKILQTTRILTIMWIILSVIFFVLGYGLTKVTY
ncbi:lysine transporter [Parasutterella muris]|uniref:lysine transporter n=1 Tax=Parasutterella muris TaxID=2565572 RepID=UPI00203F5215|nr:lysine transporter [Parasutterella muris]